MNPYIHKRDIRFTHALPVEDSTKLLEETLKNSANYALGYRIEIMNNTDRPIRVGYQDGLKVVVHNKYISSISRGVYVFKRYTFDPTHVTIELPPKSESSTEDNVEQAIVRAYNNSRRYHLENRAQAYSHVREYIDEIVYLDIDRLEDIDVAYFGNLNMVISVDLSAQWDHPLSPTGIRNAIIKGTPSMNNRDTFTLSMQIVTPYNITIERYANLYGRIYKIPAVYDPVKPPGVYLTDNQNCTDYLKSTKPWVNRYDLSELDKPRKGKGKEISEIPIPLYPTYHEALINGNQEAIQEQEFKERLAELEREKIELKHRIEMEGLKRKEVSEIIRWIPTVLAGLLTLASYFIKISK